MSLTKKQLGNKVKELRKIKSKSLGKTYTGYMLARDLDMSQSYISDIENGRTYPSYVVLSNICNVFNVSLSYFDDDNEDFK